MRTILSIIGARPQFIKHAPMQVQLQKHFRALTLHTGQHYDANMSQVFFDELKIPLADYVLDIAGAKTQSEQTGMMMAGIEDVCAVLKPDAVLVYGDTNSTLAGALVAAKMGIPLIHIEAGIRSYNRSMPEEINRIIADTFGTILLCPIPQAAINLQLEGIKHEGVHVTGDVMCDLVELVRPKIQSLVGAPYYFATIHRPYNTESLSRMTRILATLNSLGHIVIFSVHPRTRRKLLDTGIYFDDYPNIRFIDPIGYLDCLSYQSGAECIITDSGGIQKEAYMLGKKCITLRSETEWNETLTHGWNILVFNDIESIGQLIKESPGDYIADLFGDGHAAEAIANIIRNHFALFV